MPAKHIQRRGFVRVFQLKKGLAPKDPVPVLQHGVKNQRTTMETGCDHWPGPSGPSVLILM